MRRRAILSVIAIMTLLFLTTGTALALLARHVPAFYVRTASPAGTEREFHCREFFARSAELHNKMSDDGPWQQEFTQEQFNSYFQTQDEDNEMSSRIVEIPEDIKDIRIAFDQDIIRIGFRYGEGEWSCIVSVEFRLWLVAQKTNVIALELCDFRAGALPLGTRSMIDFITESARRQNINVTWFRHAGHPVARLQLQANQSRPTFQLRRLEVTPGKFIVASSPTKEPTASAPPPPAAPADPGSALPIR